MRARASVHGSPGLALAVCLACALAGASPVAAEAAVGLERIARFHEPVHVAQPPGQPRTLYVVEQPGRVMIAHRDRRQGEPFLDIRRQVRYGPAESSSVETGLLSIAFDPGYERNRRFYVYYTGNDGDNHVDSYRARRSELRARRTTRREVIEIPHPVIDSHNGGQLQFAADGTLWISTGDGGCCGDGFDNARNLESPLGKLLRIAPVPGGYEVPADNPLVGAPGMDEVYAWGLRNPWRFSFDRATGALALGDVGDNPALAEEEIDYLPASAVAGTNFGWPEYEGFGIQDPERPGPGEPVPPVHSYGHQSGACAVTGGYVVRDPRLPSLAGRYLFADFCLGRIASLAPPPAPGTMAAPTPASDVRDEGLAVSLPSSFGEDLGGRIYVASKLGPVYRLAERSRATPDRRARATARGGGLRLRRVAGFDSPVYAENAPGEPRLLFVVEQPGTIRVVRGGRKLKRPFLDIRDEVSFGGEEGLLGLAFHPRYARNRRFFVYYVTNGGDLRVDGFRRRRGSDTRAARGSRRKVIEIGHPTAANHNGGQLSFGPDGLLYLGPGDGGASGDPEEDAQNPGSLLGKILRIDPKRRRGYRSPASNPFAGGPGRDEIFALGLRNPYRFSFDAAGGELTIADVGQNDWEEIDHVSLDRARGANFGWDLFEGNHEFEGNLGNPPPNYVGPIHEYATGSGGTCAVTGGYVVRDAGLPALGGRYVYGDFCGGEIRSLDPDAANPSGTDASTGLRVDGLSSFGEGSRNRLYVTSLRGPVYRIAQR